MESKEFSEKRTLTNKFAEWAEKFLESKLLSEMDSFHKEYLASQKFKKFFLQIGRENFQRPGFRRKEVERKRKEGGSREEAERRRGEEVGNEEEGERRREERGRMREEGEREEGGRKERGGEDEGGRREEGGGEEGGEEWRGENGRFELIKLFGEWDQGGREMAEAMEGMVWVETMRKASFV